MDALTADGGAGRAEARALLLLDQLAEVGPATVRRLVDRFGSAEAALVAPRYAFAMVAGDAAARARSNPAIARAVDRGLARAERLGIQVRSWNDAEYPQVLGQLVDQPPVLFLRGRLELLERPSVTVVGARKATNRSRDVAERLGRALARADVVVVSGMALGIDGAGHRGALAVGGDTIAVLGTGPDVTYPRGNARELRGIIEHGLIVSEFLPGTPALPHHFPRRNRILAALSPATVVVEAGARSGALITVDHALDLGRDVWVVPGPIEQATCAGSNRLLVDGARPLVSIADFVGAVAPGAGDSQLAMTLPTGPEGRLLAALADGPLELGELAARLGLGIAEAMALVTALEVAGAVTRLPGMRFRAAA